MTKEQKRKILRNAVILFNIAVPLIAFKGKKKIMAMGVGLILDYATKNKKKI